MKKNVIFRSGSLRMGGLERVLIEVLQTIDREKFNITLVIDDDCGEANIFEKDIPKDIKYYFLKSQELIKKTEYHKERKKNIFHKLMYNLFMNLETVIVCRNMQKLVKKLGHIDVLIDFDSGASKYIEKIKVDKKIAWIHNSIPKLKKKKSKIARFGKRLEKYDKVVAICDDMKLELQSIYPKIKDKIIRIYNPFNFERIEKLKDEITELTKDELALLKDEYIIAISRLDTVQKDYKTLIKAMKILKEKGITKKLYIVGDGPSRKEIEELINKYEVEENVILLGNRKNPYVWLSNALFFVHSSKYEGLPTVLIEALICNKMIISSDCPTGPKEILKNETCGKLFEVGDYIKLAKLLEDNIEDRRKLDDYNKNILLRKEEFNKNIVIKEYENLIENI